MTPFFERPWLILVGPTSVGKTNIASLMALELNTDILVADSRQVYRGMNIATNKPTPSEQKRVARHLIDLVEPDTSFSAGAYKREAESAIARLEKDGKPILIEGGTGLYIKALLYGLWEGPQRDATLRQTLLDLEQKEGVGALHRKLAEVDPISASKIHFRDLSKMARALEVFYITGRPISSFHEEHRFQSNRKRSFLIIGFRRDRSDLYRKIEERVDQQFQSGLVLETKRLLQKGYSPALPSMRALGYKQVIPYIHGETRLEETVSILKRDTRNYAKRQMTWFSADPNIEWIDIKEAESPEETFARVKNLNCYKGML